MLPHNQDCWCQPHTSLWEPIRHISSQLLIMLQIKFPPCSLPNPFSSRFGCYTFISAPQNLPSVFFPLGNGTAAAGQEVTTGTNAIRYLVCVLSHLVFCSGGEGKTTSSNPMPAQQTGCPVTQCTTLLTQKYPRNHISAVPPHARGGQLMGQHPLPLSPLLLS